MIHVVIAQSYEAYEWYCGKKGLNQADRKQAIPLISFSDKYRLYGRDLTSHKVAVVGKIEPRLLKQFTNELKHYGVRVPQPKDKEPKE